jgi:hypothetical protein
MHHTKYEKNWNGSYFKRSLKCPTVAQLTAEKNQWDSLLTV